MTASTGEGLGHLGGEMRAEWRAEQESATADAAEHWRRSRSLTDSFEERQHAGDRVGVTTSGIRFAGFVEEVGPDLIAFRTVFGRVDIHITPGASMMIEIVDKAQSGGTRAVAHRDLPRHALLEHDGHPDMTVGTLADPDGFDGALNVGQDFVSIIARLGGETVVPLASVLWVAPRRG